MEDIDNNDNLSKNNQRKYVFLDKATSEVSQSLGLDMSERHIQKISKDIGIPYFKVGSRLAFDSTQFENNFDNFVSKSAEDLNLQLENRKGGAVSYNQKVDAVFAFLEFTLFAPESCLDYDDFKNYLKLYDDDLYKDWKVRDIKDFLQARGIRHSGRSNERALIARQKMCEQLRLDPETGAERTKKTGAEKTKN